MDTREFRSTWNDLKKKGWTSRPGRGIDSHYYVKPGKTHHDKRGEDYFAGDGELQAYLLANPLVVSAEFAAKVAFYNLRPAQPVETASSSRRRATRQEVSAPAPSMSTQKKAKKKTSETQSKKRSAKAPTSAQPGSSTKRAKRGQQSGQDNPPIQSQDNPSSQDNLPTRSQDNHSSQDNASSPPAPEASEGLDANGFDPEVVDVAAEEDESDEEDDEHAAPEAPVLRRSSQIASLKEDVNIVQDGENPNDCAFLDSDGEPGIDEDAEYDCQGDDGVSSDLEEELESIETAETEAMFHNAFLDMVGGPGNIATGSISADILKGMSSTGWSNPVRPDVTSFMETAHTPQDMTFEDYPNLFSGYYGPSPEVMRCADSPIKLFFYFLPIELWRQNSLESNNYFNDHVEERVNATLDYQHRRAQKNPSFVVKSKQEVRLKLLAERPILPHELCRYIGLLIARTICPNREKFAHHWKKLDNGGIPRGCFGQYMPRDRFMHISTNLHFSSNADPRAAIDRAWKIRPVIEVLEQTFLKGYVLPPVFSFDEAMLPSRSSFNKLRVYMKDKPHKWGTKLFMLCCAKTAYCVRAEVYCGKAKQGDQTDVKSGPAAVLQNLSHVIGDRSNYRDMRLIVTDRFYTSVALALQLLTMGFYSIGTIITNRLGFAKTIIDMRKKRPKTVPRGTTTLAKSLHVPSMAAISWWDNKPVHFLATGGSTSLTRVTRREKSGNLVEVPCPRAIKDYHRFMGGVDVHDQLRLQRYSIQGAVRFKKYYKSLFLGLVDIAIVNAFIVYKTHMDRQSKKVSHVKFLTKLHLMLCQLREDDMNALSDMSDEEPVVIRTQTKHLPEKTNEWRQGNKLGERKRRQRACKVCSLLKDDGSRRGFETLWVCSTCRLKGQPVHLCQISRREYNGVTMSCFDIWHKKWLCGKAIRGVGINKIRARPGSANTQGDAQEDESESRGDGVESRAEESESKHDE